MGNGVEVKSVKKIALRISQGYSIEKNGLLLYTEPVHGAAQETALVE